VELDTTEMRNRLFSSGMAEKDPTEKAFFPLLAEPFLMMSWVNGQDPKCNIFQ
jgi:hypothetical protein